MLHKNNIPSISALLAQDSGRAEQMGVESVDWRADFSRIPVTSADWQAWSDPDQLQPLQLAIERLFSGSIVNHSERQPALHMALRATDLSTFNLPPEQIQAVKSSRERMLATAGRLFRGQTPIRTILHVGIGGSDLGPRLVADALDSGQSAVRVKWLATLDGRRLERLLNTLDPAKTGMVVASKSFATVETQLQAQKILAWLQTAGGAQAIDHCWAATANVQQAIDLGIPEQNIFSFPGSVGGRFSLWSSVGISAAALIGPERWQQLLTGAAQTDQQVQHDLASSPALALAQSMNALRRDFDFKTLGIVSYEPALRLLAEYLQQLIMESLGKSVTQDGQPLNGPSAPLVFGGVGTDLQHSLFQALHQGSERHPILLLGAARGQHASADFQREQLAHLLAQASALVSGVDSDDPQKKAPGNNPVMLMLTPELTPQSLGQLLATFEHAVYLLGCIWNINPFDQWGVEDGKRRAGEFREALAEEVPANDASMDGILQWLIEKS